MTRKLQFEKDAYYHVYNRGVDKRKIFIDKGDLYYFFDSIQISNVLSPLSTTQRSLKRKDLKANLAAEEKLVSIISYSLLPNHFHFILKEKSAGSISLFIKKLCISYVNFFNAKYERNGALFQGRFKASRLTLDDSLKRTSTYVNLNFKHHGYNFEQDLIKTSLFEFIGSEKGDYICDKEEIANIISEFKNIGRYKEYLKQQSKGFLEEKGASIVDVNFNELNK